MSEWSHQAALVAAVCTAAPGAVVLASSTFASGLPLPVLVATVIASALSHAVIRLGLSRLGALSWIGVWLASSAWWSTVLFVRGDSALVRSLCSGLFAAMGTILTMGIVFLGPWNESRSRAVGN